MSIYYVYIYSYPNGTPFYIGMGKNKRYLSHLKEAKSNPIPTSGEHKLNIIRKLIRDELEPIIIIVEGNITREQAAELEIFLIAEIGRKDLELGPLSNLTNGGDGNVGWSPQLRNKMSEQRKGYISAKDLNTGEKMKVNKEDPRWVNGELVGQNLGVVNSNINGALDNYILAKHITTGEVVRIKSDSDEWLSGNYVGFNKGKPCQENTRIAAINTHRGKPKSKEHNKKNSDAIKQLKWYCNFKLNKVGRFKENQQPEGYIRVSGPHKRLPL